MLAIRYRLHTVGITQNKQKCLISIVVPQGRKSVRLDQNQEKKKMKKKLTSKNKLNN